jgi:hypothetical protein
LGIGVIALGETLIAPIPMPGWSKLIDTRKEPPPVYRWLAEQPGRAPIAHLPMLDVYGLERKPAFHESLYMVYSTLHWKPLVNGYAGIEPRRYVEIRGLARTFPSVESLEAFRSVGTRYVIVHRTGYGPFQWARLQKGMPEALASGGLREVTRLGNETVYELGPAPGPSEGPRDDGSRGIRIPDGALAPVDPSSPGQPKLLGMTRCREPWLLGMTTMRRAIEQTNQSKRAKRSVSHNRGAAGLSGTAAGVSRFARRRRESVGSDEPFRCISLK